MNHDRLSALDASFLYMDSPRTPMHISSLAVYEGPVPETKELVAHLERRLDLVPRFRMRLQPVAIHRPVWVQDEKFQVHNHVRRIALPGEGTDEKLMGMVAYLQSQPLDRSRPMWDMTLIEGLTDGRFAVLSKTHHSLFDGISGADLHAVLLDLTPETTVHPEAEAKPVRRTGLLGLLREAVRDRVEDTVSTTKSLIGAARSPGSSLRAARDLAGGTFELASSLVRRAPRTPLNARISTARRFAVAQSSLGDIKSLKDELGVSVNDVILAGVAGGLRRWQRYRGGEPHDMKVMVPVSVRTENDVAGGNRVVMLVVPLPVGIRDPLVRLHRIHETMQAAKTSRQIKAGEAVVSMSNMLPPIAVAGMSQLQSRYRSFNLLVTNVPGPQVPLFLLGRRLLELYPQAPLAHNQALSVGAMSYDGGLRFGFLGDHDAMPDLHILAGGVQESMDEILWYATAPDPIVPDPMLQSGTMALV